MIAVVVAYDRASARVIEQYVFDEELSEAFLKRLDIERAYRQRPDVEVVLLNAARFEDLKKSHARYFDPDAISIDAMKQLSESLIRRTAS
jgi:hypothetical protein